MTRATVREIDGQLVLDDPDALAVALAVAKHNCRFLLAANRERVPYFVQRMAALGRSPSDVVVVLANVDDALGRELADSLMTSFDWQAIRARGELPCARGLAGRAGVQAFLDTFDRQAADKLREVAWLAVVVVDHGVAEVYAAGAVLP